MSNSCNVSWAIIFSVFLFLEHKNNYWLWFYLKQFYLMFFYPFLISFISLAVCFYFYHTQKCVLMKTINNFKLKLNFTFNCCWNAKKAIMVFLLNCYKCLKVRLCPSNIVLSFFSTLGENYQATIFDCCKQSLKRL